MPEDKKPIITDSNSELVLSKKIAVAIQFKNLIQAKKEVKLASELGADLVELRLDYFYYDERQGPLGDLEDNEEVSSRPDKIDSPIALASS